MHYSMKYNFMFQSRFIQQHAVDCMLHVVILIDVHVVYALYSTLYSVQCLVSVLYAAMLSVFQLVEASYCLAVVCIYILFWLLAVCARVCITCLQDIGSATSMVTCTYIVNVCNNTLLHAFIFVGRCIFIYDLLTVTYIYIYS